MQKNVAFLVWTSEPTEYNYKAEVSHRKQVKNQADIQENVNGQTAFSKKHSLTTPSGGLLPVLNFST